MTDNLLQQLEERTMTLLAEVEHLRVKVSTLTRENIELKTDQTSHMKKVRELLSLLDSLDLGSGFHASPTIESISDQIVSVAS